MIKKFYFPTMSRKALPRQIEAEVLVRSRRRCCICFGLSRDTDLKGGQIAHLNQDSSDDSLENLAFLCLDHHDEFDSSTSQRKGLKISEVKQYRSELYGAVEVSFQQSVHFGKVQFPKQDKFAGTYVRLGTGEDSAEVKIFPLPDTVEGSPQYFVSGFALWGTQREYGPNIGTLEFYDEIDNNQMTFVRMNGDGDAKTVMRFYGDGLLEICEENVFGYYGANVRFDGQYQRVDRP